MNAGQHTIGWTPKKIAKFLGLPDADLYTGHSFRRSAATMVVNAGGDLLILKCVGGWKSSTVAEGYIGESITQKLEVSKKMFPSNARVSSASATITSNAMSSDNENLVSTKSTPSSTIQFNISGNHNCSFVFHLSDDVEK